MSDSLWSHGLQQTRLPYPSPTPKACSNSCSSSQWSHPTISSPVGPFSFYLQSFPASGSFQWVTSSHQVAKVLELQLQHQSCQWMNIQAWLPLGWTGLILLFKGLLKVFSNSTVQSHQLFSTPLFLNVSTLTSKHDYRKSHIFDYTDPFYCN